MIETTPTPPSIARPGHAVRAPAPDGAGSFAGTLALLLPGAIDGIAGKADETLQALAGTGKDLPEEGQTVDGAVLPWLPIALPPQPVAVAPVTLRLPAQGAPAIEEAPPAIVAPAAAQKEAGSAAADLAKAFADPLAVPTPPPGKAEAPPVRIPLPAAAPLAAALARAPVAMAGTEIAAAPLLIAQALVSAQPLETGASLRRTAREAEPLLALTATAEAARPAIAVAAAGQAQQGTLDMRSDQWMGSMIDHIETLRDNADAQDTRIRLVPDALGSIDVSIRKESDRVHVHFAAEAQATRTLLADAAPRLSELAAERGLRLGNATVDGGNAQSGGQQREAPRAPLPAAPASARTEPEITDTRIA